MENNHQSDISKIKQEFKSGEKALFMHVIFEAIMDLTNFKRCPLRDENNKLVKDKKGNKIYYIIAEEATNFISGKSGALFDICKTIGISPHFFINTYRRLGAKDMQKTALRFFSKRKGSLYDPKKV